MMFTFRTNKRTSEMEMCNLNDLNLPPLDDCLYTSCYCEENVWKLCEYVKQHQSDRLPFCYVVFISNRNETVPLWCQRSGNDVNHLALWDYHVIFIYNPSRNQGTMVYDLDSILPFPVELEKYAPATLQSDDFLQPCYHRFFRVISAEIFLNKFASDRSRMLKPDGSWIKPPPPYPCLRTLESTNNLDDFVSMNSDRGVGEIMNLRQFLDRFL